MILWNEIKCIIKLIVIYYVVRSKQQWYYKMYNKINSNILCGYI